MPCEEGTLFSQAFLHHAFRSECRTVPQISAQPRGGQGQTHGRIRNLLEGVVRSNSKDNFGVRGDGHTVVAAGLEHALRLPLSGGHAPLIHGAVGATGNQPAVICIPHHGADLRGRRHTRQRVHTYTHSLPWKRRTSSSHVPLD